MRGTTNHLAKGGKERSLEARASPTNNSARWGPSPSHDWLARWPPQFFPHHTAKSEGFQFHKASDGPPASLPTTNSSNDRNPPYPQTRPCDRTRPLHQHSFFHIFPLDKKKHPNPASQYVGHR